MNSLKSLVKTIICSILSNFYGSFGKGARIETPTTLIKCRKHIFLGHNVFIRKYARIEPVIQWHEQQFNPRLVIEEGVTIEQNVHLVCAEKVQIGAFSSISSYVFITDTDHQYKDVSKPVLLQTISVNPTIIGKSCFIGTGVKVMSGVHIGEHSVIGANAVVTHDIPPYSVAAGIPARVIKKFNFEKNQWEKTE